MEFELDTFSITPVEPPHAAQKQPLTSLSAARRPPRPPTSTHLRRPDPVVQSGIVRLGGGASLIADSSSNEREFSSRDRKTKRAAFYHGRSASPLPRPPAWLGSPRDDRRSPSPSRSSSPSPSPRSSSSPSRPIRHPALVPSTRHASSTSQHGHIPSPPPSPVTRKKIFYTDTRFFLVYALENSIRARLLAIEGETGDELRSSGALGWSGSRAVRMVRKERARGLAGRGVGVRSLLSEGSILLTDEE